MEIHKTKDYKKFKDITSNREVDRKHVAKLAAAIKRKNLLAENPMQVTKELEIIDGQHRLAAAELLNEAIYYIFSTASSEDIGSLNSIQKKWAVDDYLNYYCINGRRDYLELSKLRNKYSLLSTSTALYLLAGGSRQSLSEFKAGELDITFLSDAEAICEQINTLLNAGVRFAFDRSFVQAYSAAFHCNEFDFDSFLSKVRGNLRGFVKCISRQQYLELIEETYNYRNSKNLISISR